MNDPRLTTPKSSHFVASVATTKIPLSERFGKVASHNPLRPNHDVRRIVDDLEHCGSGSFERPLTHSQRLVENLGLGPGVNKLAVLAAAKDAEILRLKAKLQNAHKKLRNGGGGNSSGLGSLKTIQKNSGGGLIFRNRVGGGVSVDRGKKQQLLNLRGQNAQALNLLQPNKSGFGISPLKRTRQAGNKGKGMHVQRNNDDEPSREDLDDELDAYMSKRKTNLDKELDNYMSVARSKHSAAKASIPSNGTIQQPAAPEIEKDSTPIPEEDADVDLIIDEEETVQEDGDMETDQ